MGRNWRLSAIIIFSLSFFLKLPARGFNEAFSFARSNIQLAYAVVLTSRDEHFFSIAEAHYFYTAVAVSFAHCHRSKSPWSFFLENDDVIWICVSVINKNLKRRCDEWAIRKCAHYIAHAIRSFDYIQPHRKVKICGRASGYRGYCGLCGSKCNGDSDDISQDQVTELW